MTSPVITDGGVATRLSDDLRYVAGDNIGGEDVGQGTMILDALSPSYTNTSSKFLVEINDGGASTDRVTGWVSSSTDRFSGLSRDSGSAFDGDCDPEASFSDNAKHTCRVTWEVDNLVAYLDSSTDADVDCGMPDDLDRINIGSTRAFIAQSNSLLQNIRIYDEPTTLG